MQYLLVQVRITQRIILGKHYYTKGYKTGPQKIEEFINIERPKD